MCAATTAAAAADACGGWLRPPTARIRPPAINLPSGRTARGNRVRARVQIYGPSGARPDRPGGALPAPRRDDLGKFSAETLRGQHNNLSAAFDEGETPWSAAAALQQQFVPEGKC
uniref:Uncharacterized protein n=1 Tax=Globodera rostochiensis TaxID=31243 RepID=A0A914HIE3_GLORO